MFTRRLRLRPLTASLVLTNILLLLATAILALFLTLTNVRLATLEGRLIPPNRPLSTRLTAELTQPLVDLINEARIQADRQPIQLDAQLVWVAQLRADDMAAQDYYAHTNPATHESAASILSSFGGLNTFVGENIWICADWQMCTPTLIHETFMSSPAHANNLRRPDYTHVGLGFSAIRQLLYVVELFSNQSIGFVQPSSAQP